MWASNFEERQLLQIISKFYNYKSILLLNTAKNWTGCNKLILIIRERATKHFDMEYLLHKMQNLGYCPSQQRSKERRKVARLNPEIFQALFSKIEILNWLFQ
jgi:hypothetical protein